jgi:hypothetical protein
VYLCPPDGTGYEVYLCARFDLQFADIVRARRGRRDGGTAVVSATAVPVASPGMVMSLLPKASRLMTSCVSGRLGLAPTLVPSKSNSLRPKEAQSMAGADG